MLENIVINAKQAKKLYDDVKSLEKVFHQINIKIKESCSSGSEGFYIHDVDFDSYFHFEKVYKHLVNLGYKVSKNSTITGKPTYAYISWGN